MSEIEYELVEEVIAVPRGTGIEGFVRTIRQVLKLGRVQGLRITSQGQVEYSYLKPKDKEKPIIELHFDTILPMALVANANMQEVPNRDDAAAIAILQMFRAAAIDHLQPIAFVMGAASHFWAWYERTTSLQAEIRTVLAGLPVFVDRHCPDEVLLLCAAYQRNNELIDLQKSYKIDIPKVTP